MTGKTNRLPFGRSISKTNQIYVHCRCHDLLSTLQYSVQKDDDGIKTFSVPAGVDGVWDPSHSNDLTVRLETDIQEDLDQELEYFCELYKTGSFTKARSFFDHFLATHRDSKPHVFVMYAEMLFRQGSFDEIANLPDGVMRKPIRGAAQQAWPRLLGEYWQLIRLISREHNSKATPPPANIILSLEEDLNRHVTVDGSTSPGSIEIGMICRMIEARHIWRNQTKGFLIGGLQFGDAIQSIYNNLLRVGRVWDMQDLLGAGLRWDWRAFQDLFTKITGHSFLIESLRQIIEDWTESVKEDVSTTLALLNLLSDEGLRSLERRSLETLDDILDLAAPLAVSLAQKDAKLTKSRSYTRWVLAKACGIAFKDPHLFDYQEVLKSSPGYSYPSKLSLPTYIPDPNNIDNPGWKRPEVSPDITKAIKLAINNSRDLEDYETEDWALRLLILISDNPTSEFEDLCELHHIQGRTRSYLRTLLSSYLASNTEPSKTRLKAKLTEQISNHLLQKRFSPYEVWEANMILYALEKEGPQAEQALKVADNCVKDLEDAQIERIEVDIPHFRQDVDSRRAVRRRESEDDELEEEQKRLDKERSEFDLKQLELDRRREDAEARREQIESNGDDTSLPESIRTIHLSDELGLITKSNFFDRKKIRLIIEDMDNSAHRTELSYPPETSQQFPARVQGYEPAPSSTGFENAWQPRCWGTGKDASNYSAGRKSQSSNNKDAQDPYGYVNDGNMGRSTDMLIGEKHPRRGNPAKVLARRDYPYEESPDDHVYRKPTRIPNQHHNEDGPEGKGLRRASSIESIVRLPPEGDSSDAGSIDV